MDQIENNTDFLFEEVIEDEYAGSYNPRYLTFELCLNKLCSLGEMLAKQPSRRGREGGVAEWGGNISKLVSGIKRLRSLDSIKPMFESFLNKHRASLEQCVFDDEGRVVDAFFKQKGVVNGSSSSKLEGPVIYYKEGVVKFESVCFPLGEVYRAALTQYAASAENDSTSRVLPTLVILYTYAIMNHVDPDSEAIRTNMLNACHLAEMVSPKSGPGAVVETPSNPIQSMLGSFLGGGASKQMEGISGLMATLVDSMKKTSGNDVTADNVLPNLVQTLQDPNVNDKFKNVFEGVMSMMGGPLLSASSAPHAVDSTRAIESLD